MTAAGRGGTRAASHQGGGAGTENNINGFCVFYVYFVQVPLPRAQEEILLPSPFEVEVEVEVEGGGQQEVVEEEQQGEIGKEEEVL